MLWNWHLLPGFPTGFHIMEVKCPQEFVKYILISILRKATSNQCTFFIGRGVL